MNKQRWLHAALAIAVLCAGAIVWRQVHYERTKHLSRESIRNIAPSPDGAKIAFSMTVSGQPGVYVVDVATGEIRPVLHGTEGQGAWSNSGGYFAVVDDARNALVGPSDTLEVHPVGENCFYVDWATARDELVVLEQDRTSLAATSLALVPVDPIHRSSVPVVGLVTADWAGERIAAVVRIPPSRPDVAPMYQVVDFAPDGGTPRTLTPDPILRPNAMRTAGSYIFLLPREPFESIGSDRATLLRWDVRTGERSETELAVRQMGWGFLWSPSPDGERVAAVFHGLTEDEAALDPTSPAGSMVLVYEYPDASAPAKLICEKSVSPSQTWRPPLWAPGGNAVMLTDADYPGLRVTIDLTTPSMGPWWPGADTQNGIEDAMWLTDDTYVAGIGGPGEAGMFVVDRYTGARTPLVLTRPWDAEDAFPERLKMAWKVLFP